ASVYMGRHCNAWRYRVRRVLFRRLVRRLGFAPGTLSVLDVGCGTGFYLQQWQTLGVASMAGLDISDWVVAKLARAYPSATFYRANVGAADSPLRAAAFDAVTALDVLVHLVDDGSYSRALENLHPSLIPGGYVRPDGRAPRHSPPPAQPTHLGCLHGPGPALGFHRLPLRRFVVSGRAAAGVHAEGKPGHRNH